MRKHIAALGLCALAACAGGASGVSTSTQNFATQVASFDADAQAKIAAFNSGALLDVQAVGKSACGYLSMADGLFKLALPVAIIAGADPAIGATEAAVFTGVKLGCAVVDSADPSLPAASLASAAAQVVAAIPQVKSALKAADPSLAAAASAPAQAAAK